MQEYTTLFGNNGVNFTTKCDDLEDLDSLLQHLKSYGMPQIGIDGDDFEISKEQTDRCATILEMLLATRPSVLQAILDLPHYHISIQYIKDVALFMRQCQGFTAEFSYPLG